MSRKPRRPGAQKSLSTRRQVAAALLANPPLSDVERDALDQAHAEGNARLAALVASRRLQDPVMADEEQPARLLAQYEREAERREVESQLRKAHANLQRATRSRDRAIRSARSAGLSWHAIGVILGMTGEGVRARFRSTTPGADR